VLEVGRAVKVKSWQLVWPMHPVSRQFRDLSGIMNQEFARAADKVYFMKFGIAQELK